MIGSDCAVRMELETNSTSPPRPRTSGSSRSWFRKRRQYRRGETHPLSTRLVAPSLRRPDHLKIYFFNGIGQSFAFVDRRSIGRSGTDTRPSGPRPGRRVRHKAAIGAARDIGRIRPIFSTGKRTLRGPPSATRTQKKLQSIFKPSTAANFTSMSWRWPSVNFTISRHSR